MDMEAYEQGAKRISAKLLLETATILRVQPSFFFLLLATQFGAERAYSPQTGG
jgi:hypothetical protein